MLAKYLTPTSQSLPDTPSSRFSGSLCELCASLLCALCVDSVLFSSDLRLPIPSYKVPYLLPSSVSSKPFVFTLFTKLPGCTPLLPELERLAHTERKSHE